MKNAPCTPVTREEEVEIMSVFPAFLSREEEDQARIYFPKYLFFEAHGKTARWCWCSSCLSSGIVSKENCPAFFKVTHGNLCECPFCGQAAELKALGKFKNMRSLTSRERCVRIFAFHGLLLAEGGTLYRSFSDQYDEGIVEEFTYHSWTRYVFAPGVRQMWEKTNVQTCSPFRLNEAVRHGFWRRKSTIREPFQTAMGCNDATYIVLNFGDLSKTKMRYCQVAEWFDTEFGGLIGGMDFTEDPARVYWIMKYLGEYTRRPQMEFLIKLGFHEVVSDLVLRKQQHGDILNWKAKNPPDFFRMSKGDFRYFSQNNIKFSGLKMFHALRKQGNVSSLEEYVGEQARTGKEFEFFSRCCLLADVSFTRARNYLRQFECRCPGYQLHSPTQYWLDYLEAAKKLRYDLTRDDVRMPKDLGERHDAATRSARFAEDRKLAKAYKIRYAQLVKQYELSDGKLCVRVPETVQEIVEEGRLLQHCVGGYADRHISGAVTILFLRKCKNPEAPYVTIEMSVDNNCKNLKIKQIHGFRNDRDVRVSPMEKHREFLGRWLEWVHGGSHRDAEGAPVLPEDKEKPKTA